MPENAFSLAKSFYLTLKDCQLYCPEIRFSLAKGLIWQSRSRVGSSMKRQIAVFALSLGLLLLVIGAIIRENRPAWHDYQSEVIEIVPPKQIRSNAA